MPSNIEQSVSAIVLSASKLKTVSAAVNDLVNHDKAVETANENALAKLGAIGVAVDFPAQSIHDYATVTRQKFTNAGDPANVRGAVSLFLDAVLPSEYSYAAYNNAVEASKKPNDPAGAKVHLNTSKRILMQRGRIGRAAAYGKLLHHASTIIDPMKVVAAGNPWKAQDFAASLANRITKLCEDRGDKVTMEEMRETTSAHCHELMTPKSNPEMTSEQKLAHSIGIMAKNVQKLAKLAKLADAGKREYNAAIDAAMAGIKRVAQISDDSTPELRGMVDKEVNEVFPAPAPAIVKPRPNANRNDAGNPGVSINKPKNKSGKLSVPNVDRNAHEGATSDNSPAPVQVEEKLVQL